MCAAEMGESGSGHTIAELLANNPTVDLTVSGDTVRLFRRRQLLVGRQDLEPVALRMRHDIDHVEDLTDDLVRVQLSDRPGATDLPGLAAMLRADGVRDVALNYVLSGCAVRNGPTPNDPQPEDNDDDDDDDSTTDSGRPTKGEWWGGAPGDRRPHPPAGTMSAQSLGTPPDLAPGTLPGQGDQSTGDDHVGPNGEWWGGPVGNAIPSERFALGPGVPPVRPVTVAILDTGIISHDWWQASAWFGAVAPDDLEVIGDNGRGPLAMQAGHGSFITGVILQQAPSATVRMERVLSNDGLCDEAELIRVLQRLVDEAATGSAIDVLNLSFGGYADDSAPSRHVLAAIRALAPTTAIVAAAGNYGSPAQFWPAAMDEVVAVGALKEDGVHRARFSNYGPWVNAYRIGVNVASSYVTYRVAGGDPTRTDFKGYATWSGTSFAAPAVAGQIAALAATGMTGPEAAAALLTKEPDTQPPSDPVDPPIATTVRVGTDNDEDGGEPANGTARQVSAPAAAGGPGR